MKWTWSKHLCALGGVVAIVVLGVWITLLVGNEVKTQVLSSSETTTLVTIPLSDPNQDSDGDKLLDSEETILYHTDLLKMDTDGDGLSDYEEVKIYHTDPIKFDTNNNGYSDGRDVVDGFSPTHAERVLLTDVDTDEDGLSDALELKLGTDTQKVDTDGDGLSDKDEVYLGNNPGIFGDVRDAIERHVEVDLTHQQLHYFMNNIELGMMPISSGLPSKPTPRGTFTIFRKLPIAEYRNDTPGDVYDLKNVHWNLEFKHGYFLHEAYWHNQFGIRSMSHGCINMRLADVAQLYQFLDIGDRVMIYGKTPIGKVKTDDIVVQNH
jgi:hypothetical protein